MIVFSWTLHSGPCNFGVLGGNLGAAITQWTLFSANFHQNFAKEVAPHFGSHEVTLYFIVPSLCTEAFWRSAMDEQQRPAADGSNSRAANAAKRNWNGLDALAHLRQ